MRGLGDHELLAPTSDTPRLAEDHAQVVVRALDPALCLRDDLLGDHEDVARLGPAKGREGNAEEAEQIVSGPHLRDAKEGQNPKPTLIDRDAHPSSPVIRTPAFAL